MEDLQRPTLLLATPDRRLERTILTSLEALPIDTVSVRTSSALQERARQQTAAAILIDDILANAYDVTQQLSQIDNARIIMLVEDEATNVERAYAAGALDLLIKPLRLSELNARVRHWLVTTRVDQAWFDLFERASTRQLLVAIDDGRILDANPSACQFYGYSRDQMRALTLADLESDVDEGLETSSTPLRYRHRLANGDIRQVRIYPLPIERYGQTISHLTIFDVTRRVRAEAAEIDQRLLAEALRSTASALSATLDEEAVLDRVLEQVVQVVPNESANIMLVRDSDAVIVRARGYEQFTDQPIIGLHLPLRETLNLHAMVDTRQPMIIPDVTHFGGWVRVPQTETKIRGYLGVPISIGSRVIGFINCDSATANRFTYRDGLRLQAFADQASIAIRNARLYERVKQQAVEMEQRVADRTAELHAERAQLLALIDAMTEGVAYAVLKGHRGETIYVNRALERMSGYSADKWLNVELPLVTNEANAIRRQFAEAYRNGSARQELTITRRDGSRFIAAVTMNRVEGIDGVISGIVSVVRDISREKALEEQKARFVAHASHELRTPLTNLKTRLYLMRRMPDALDTHLDILDSVTDRMKSLVEDLLDMSRFERGVIRLNRQPTDLHTLTHAIVDLQRQEAERAGITLTCVCPTMAQPVLLDPGRITQVVTNLLMNALHYTSPGGEITVTVSYDDELNPSHAIISVEDTGIGIAAEHLPHIFEPFFRIGDRGEGTGLGLSIARQIVEEHGGSIGVSSTPGVGSRFEVRLPIIGTGAFSTTDAQPTPIMSR